MAKVNMSAGEKMGDMRSPERLKMEIDGDFVVAVCWVDFPATSIPGLHHNFGFFGEGPCNPTLMAQLFFFL